MNEIIEMLGGKLLSYGVSGFAVIMIGLTYYQMKSEFSREEPRKIVLKTIWMFMGLVMLSTIAVGFFTLPIANKNKQLEKETTTQTGDLAYLLDILAKKDKNIKLLETELAKHKRIITRLNARSPIKIPIKTTIPKLDYKNIKTVKINKNNKTKIKKEVLLKMEQYKKNPMLKRTQ